MGYFDAFDDGLFLGRDGAPGAVLYSEQDLTPAQREQARANIGAEEAGSVAAVTEADVSGWGFIKEVPPVVSSVTLDSSCTLCGGTISDATLEGTIYNCGIICGGYTYGGDTYGGTICGGTISDAILEGTTHNVGDICGGTFSSGVITDGTICGGYICGAVLSGTIYNYGTICGGTVCSGTISDVTLSGTIYYSETTFLPQISGNQLIFVPQ